MGLHFAIFGILIALDGQRPAEVSWSAGVPLWTALSPTGKVVDAGPFSDWTGPPVAARLGTIAEQSRPAPEPLPRPRELPEALDIVTGPILPPGLPLTQLVISPPTMPGLTPRPESTSPPNAIQATQRRPIQVASDNRPSPKPSMPLVAPTTDDSPAARLAMPKP